MQEFSPFSRHWSLLEIMVALSIFATILMGSYQLLFSAQNQLYQYTLIKEIELQMLQTSQQIQEELSSTVYLDPPGIRGMTAPAIPGIPLPPHVLQKFPQAVSLITFSKIIGWDSTENPQAIPPTPGPIFGPAITYFFHPENDEIGANNRDDNQNGLVDEGILYKLSFQENREQIIRVCRWIRDIDPPNYALYPTSPIFSDQKLKGIFFELNEESSLLRYELALERVGRDGKVYRCSTYNQIKLRR